jgi:GTP-binding protein
MKIRSLELESTVLDYSKFPESGMSEVAVAGRSNVGKSSLLNTLFNRKNLARVSREPGKTRTVNFFLVNGSFYLVDLPGYGYAKVSKVQRESWQRVITGYLRNREPLSGVVQLVDARHDPTKDDLMMFQKLIDADRDFLIVLTKADKLKRSQRAGKVSALRSYFAGISVGPVDGTDEDGEPFEVPFVFSSAVTKEGKDEIWKWIAERI